MLSNLTAPLTYTLTVPEGVSDCYSFEGTADYLSGGEAVTVETTGETELCELACLPHAVDTNEDFQIAVGELLLGVEKWKGGDASISISALLVAVNIWKHGELYECDVEGKHVPTASLSGKRAGAGKRAVPRKSETRAQDELQAARSLPDSCVPGQAFTVSIEISTSANLFGLGVTETVPAGWTVSSVDNAGEYIAASNEVRWFLLDGFNTTLGYEITPDTNAGAFSGTVSYLLDTGGQTEAAIQGDVLCESETAVVDWAVY